jgi:hypothetical protein
MIAAYLAKNMSKKVVVVLANEVLLHQASKRRHLFEVLNISFITAPNLNQYIQDDCYFVVDEFTWLLSKTEL